MKNKKYELCCANCNFVAKFEGDIVVERNGWKIQKEGTKNVLLCPKCANKK